jgi:acetyl-CoA carboxylase biotin carboxylase subunit
MIDSRAVFRRILIANRGEIARRVARACRTLGIETVCVHSEADAGAAWLADMDQAVCVGPAAAASSYLDADAVLQAAEQTECQALHPGYGFLSENARFAARCAQAGLTFIGPTPDALRRMGDKAVARRTLGAAGLPTVPGSPGILASVEEAAAAAEAVGYPVLLKAAAGGGGKGMRRCAAPADLARGFAEASMEAEKAFGDPGLYLEKLVLAARHIEFLMLVDGFGRAVHLGERECSVQRQHQKLLEEAPSPALSQAERESFGARVATAMAEVGYRNAGTVEFLRAPDGSLYFMEVNARLQVEHPVTEMVTGVDLVVQQIRLAAGEPLALVQEELRPRGHAIELRINAEDPEAGFPPWHHHQAEAPGAVRWDGGFEEGSRVPPHYDSLIGKLIVHAPDRARAIEAARGALDAMVVEGVKTTIPLHKRVLDDPQFRSGRYDLDLLTAARAGR